MKTLVLTLLILNCWLHGFADEPRLQTRFISQNNLFSIELLKANKWDLKNYKGQTLYSIKDERFSSMKMLVSNDGQKIVVIDDFSEGISIGNKKALWFFNAGKLKKEYKYQDILEDTCNVTHSIWHLRWSLSDFGFSNSDSLFKVSTFEFYDFVFDTSTGELLKKQRPDEFEANSVIVYGSFIKGDKPAATMNVSKYIVSNGPAKNVISFKTKHYGAGEWTTGLIITNGQDVTPLRYRGEIYLIYNCSDHEKGSKKMP